MRNTKVLRDTKANLPTSLPLGEIAFANDTEELFVGQGVGKSLKKVSGSELADLKANKRDKATKINKDDMDISSNAKKLGLNNLADEVHQALSGNAQVSPTIPNGSITTEKYAQKSIQYSHVDNTVTSRLGDYRGVITVRTATVDTSNEYNYKKGDYFVVKTTGELAICNYEEEVYIGENAIVVWNGTKWEKVTLASNNNVFENPHINIGKMKVIDVNRAFLHLEVYDPNFLSDNPDKDLVLGSLRKIESENNKGSLAFYSKVRGKDAQMGETLWSYDYLDIPEGATGIQDVTGNQGKIRCVINWDLIPCDTETYYNIYDERGYSILPQCFVQPTPDKATKDTLANHNLRITTNALDIEIANMKHTELKEGVQSALEEITLTKDFYTYSSRKPDEYNTSTFSGWTTFVGKPIKFTQFRFFVKARENITKIKVILREDSPTGTKLLEKDFDFNVLKGTERLLSIDLPYTNTEGKHLYLTYMCDNLCTLIPFGNNPYSVDGVVTHKPRYFTGGAMNTDSLGVEGGNSCTYVEFGSFSTSYQLKEESFAYSFNKHLQSDNQLVNKALQVRESVTDVFCNGTGVIEPSYDLSTFKGWGCRLGTPNTFNILKFRVKNRSSKPLKQLKLIIRDTNINGEILHENTYMITETSPQTWNTITIALDEIIYVEDRDLYVQLSFPLDITLGWNYHKEGMLDGETFAQNYYTLDGKGSEWQGSNIEQILPYIETGFRELDIYPTTTFIAKNEEFGNKNVSKLLFDNSFEESNHEILLSKFPQVVSKQYTTSIFSGWGSLLAPATEIRYIKFKIANRDIPVTQVKVYVTRKDKNGEILAHDTIDIIPTESGADIEIVWKLKEPIYNPNNDHLYFIYQANQISDVYGLSGTITFGDTWGIASYSVNGEYVGPSAMTEVYGGKSAFQIATEIIDYEAYYKIKPEILPSVSAKSTDVRIVLPDKFQAVVGDTLQIFYRGIVEAVDPYIYDIRFTCSRGSAYPRYFEYTPKAGDEGYYNITVEVKDNLGNSLGMKTTVLEVVSVKSPSTPLNILCIGDSLTSSGFWVTEACRRLTQSEGSPSGNALNNINFIGTKTGAYNSKWEGYGGWTWDSYLAKPSETTLDINVFGSHDKTIEDQHSIWQDSNGNKWSLETITTGKIKFTRYQGHTGTPPTGSGQLTHVSNATNTTPINYTSIQFADGNPFWDTTTNKVNFKAYCDRNGFSGIDVVYTLLTWNGGRVDKWSEELNKSFVDSAKKLIDLIHESYPNAKIKVMGVQLPSLNGGCGTNYGANGGYSYTYGLVRGVFGLNLAYQEFVNEDEYKDFVEFVNVSGQFDSEYNMPYTTKKVNTRSTVTEMFGNNGVHPSTEGYYQIADVMYRNFLSRL